MKQAVGALAASSRAGSGLEGIEMSASDHISSTQFSFRIDDGILDDLALRLKRTRWNDAVQEGWSYGTDRKFLVSLIEYWQTKYDWRAREEAMNRLPLRKCEIDGFRINFLHLRGLKGSRPILLMNGWPSSFLEYAKLAPLLTASDPNKLGPTFDLVIPSLPGFAFSERPTSPFQVDSVDVFCKLMTDVLGYKKFLAVGTDIGAGVATRMALKYPESLWGIHVTSVVDPPGPQEGRDLSSAEHAYIAQQEKWNREEGAYEALQCTRPQTLAFGLADSPAGLASWIVEKFYNWSDCGGDVLSIFPMDSLLDNIMIYWITETIGSSVRYYYESRHFRPPLKPGQFVTVPTAVTVFPKDLVQPPREWAERFYNVRHYSMAERGGHFPAWEVPSLYAEQIRSFVAAI